MSEDVGTGRSRSPRRAVIVTVWTAYSGALLAASFIPGQSVPDFALLGWDKLAHAVAFGILALLTLPVLNSIKWRLWLALGYGTAMGGASELFQSFTPGRWLSPYDWLADVVGTAVPLIVVWAYARCRNARRRESDGNPHVRLTPEEIVLRSREA